MCGEFQEEVDGRICARGTRVARGLRHDPAPPRTQQRRVVRYLRGEPSQGFPISELPACYIRDAPVIFGVSLGRGALRLQCQQLA